MLFKHFARNSAFFRSLFNPLKKYMNDAAFRFGIFSMNLGITRGAPFIAQFYRAIGICT